MTNKLVFSLNLPKHRTIEVRLDPAWIAEESGTGKFNLGAKFVEMSEEGIAAVQHFHSHALVH